MMPRRPPRVHFDRMPRLAWFSPLPPVRSGIARYCSDLLPGLAGKYDIDLFVDGPPVTFELPHERVQLFDAHDFIWKHLARPYDLIVYQLGNAPCHDYMWAYLVRHPGLVVLHDGQLHHARGRMLLQRWQPRRDDYRREFRFNHPHANPAVAEIGAVGLLGSLTYLWPMLRIVVESSRSVLVHNDWLADQIREAHPGGSVELVEMGVAEPAPHSGSRARLRSRHGIVEDDVVFTAFGKVTPEKRVREAMRALALVVESAPHARLLVAGEAVDYYDLQSEAERLGLSGRVTFSGYLADENIDDYLAASDVCLCMRWPTSRETSASWLRCLAAGKPTISTDLVHTVDIPTLDPRNWSVLAGLSAVARQDRASSGETRRSLGEGGKTSTTEDGHLKASTATSEAAPVGVSIDILDEDHSLKLAIRRLAMDAKLRVMLGSNARGLWSERFRLESMVAGYHRVVAQLLQTPAADAAGLKMLPLHLRASGAEHAESIVREIVGPEYHLLDAD
jgi:glycosyltransferase involved in cell wall biosynthesis